MRSKLFACAAIAMVGLVGCEDINGPVGDPVDLSYRACTGSTDAPTWFAVQDGDGDWQRVNSTSGAYNFSISSGRGGVAMYSDATGLFIVYASTEELESALPACNGSTRNVTGTVTGYTSGDRVRLSLGDAEDAFSGAEFAAPTSWGVGPLNPGVSDLVSVRYRTNVGSATVVYEEFPDRILLRRNVTGTTTSLVDMLSTEAFAPIQRDLAVTNMVGGEQLIVSSNVALNTTVGQIAFFEGQAVAGSGVAVAQFYGAPAAQLAAGEAHVIGVSAVRTVGGVDQSRFATEVFSAPVDHSMTLGPALGSVSVTGSSRPSATYSVQSDYDGLFEVVFSQPGARVDILATKAYLGSSPGNSITIAMPNLTGVSGFSAEWGMIPGFSGTWQFLATNASIAIFTTQALSYRGAERVATFTP